jgi:hypothetical protein
VLLWLFYFLENCRERPLAIVSDVMLSSCGAIRAGTRLVKLAGFKRTMADRASTGLLLGMGNPLLGHYVCPYFSATKTASVADPDVVTEKFSEQNLAVSLVYQPKQYPSFGDEIHVE